jgi:hypothetical protein
MYVHVTTCRRSTKVAVFNCAVCTNHTNTHTNTTGNTHTHTHTHTHTCLSVIPPEGSLPPYILPMPASPSTSNLCDVEEPQPHIQHTHTHTLTHTHTQKRNKNTQAHLSICHPHRGLSPTIHTTHGSLPINLKSL